jgi:hypothetical protein
MKISNLIIPEEKDLSNFSIIFSFVYQPKLGKNLTGDDVGITPSPLDWSI